MLAKIFLATLVAIPLSDRNEGTELAWSDSQRYTETEALKLRYALVTGPMNDQVVEDAKGTIFTINGVSNSPILYRPDVVANKQAFLVRINTRSLCTDDKDWLRFIDVWEELSYDPLFNGFITEGQQGLVKEFSDLVLGGFSKRWTLINHGNGVKVRTLIGEPAFQTIKRDGVVRTRPNGLTPTWEKLAKRLGTEAPIVDHRYMTYRFESSAQDARKVYNKIFGGLYYRAADIPDDFDKLLAKLGLFPQGKTGAFELLEKFRTDQRVAMWRSKVTGKQRRIDVFNSRFGGREGRQGLVAITTDFGKGDFDLQQSPMANLLDLKNAKAHEIIFEMANGLHGFMLTDAKFKRQNVVPPDVAADRTIPWPHETELQAGISCKRCHGLHRDDGWKDAPNDVLTALRSGRWNVFGDFRRLLKGEDQDDALQRMAGLYGGNFEESFQWGRKTYVKAVFSITGPFKGSKGFTDTVALASWRVGDVYKRYWYDSVDAKGALEDLGISVDGNYVDEFHERVTPRTMGGFTLEPAAVSALRVGLSPNRADWALVMGHINLATGAKK